MTPSIIGVGTTKIPKIGFGTYKITGEECATAVEDALQIGYRHLDTARMYDNEAEVGRGIRSSGIAREDIFVTTKVWPADFRNLIEATEDSLRKLQMDRVDLLLLHWPADDETTRAGVELLNEVLHKGYAKTVGVSNFTIEQLEAARQVAPLICDQVEYHPYLSQQKLLTYLREHDMLLTAYRPLALGKVSEDAVLLDIASRYKKTAGQVTLRWLIQQDGVVIIPKTVSHDRRVENFDISDFSLTDEEMAAIHALARNERITNPATAPKWD